MSGIILAAAPVMFHAEVPSGLLLYFVKLSLFIIASLGIAGVLGMLEKNQAKLTMLSQLVFLPSIMLSGIMFPISLLPDLLEAIGRVFPAFWGYRSMLDNGLCFDNLWYLVFVCCMAVMVCAILLNKQKSK